MKTAIYIEDGDTQLVLTPENEWERNALKSLSQGDLDARWMHGEFYECSGGWHRHSSHSECASVILRVKRDTQ